MARTSLMAVCIAGIVAGSVSCSRQIQQVVVDTELVNAASDDASRKASAVGLNDVDHSSWDDLLSRYVDDDGMVNYRAWHESSEDRAALKHYLAVLSAADVTAAAGKNGKLAFWINAYNALTVYGILEVYPTDSIRNHTAKLVGYNIWDDLLLPVGGKQHSLNEIEHQILRKMGEPRIHFAIVCASVGCPRLLNRAYEAESIETQLAANTKDFFSRRKNLQVDHATRTVRVSSILDWFGEDFGATPQAVLSRVVEYVPDEATKKVIADGDFTVSFLEYDWSLNKQ